MVRPGKPEAERRSRTICVRVTTAEAAAIAVRAAEARLTKGAYMRRRALGSRGRDGPVRKELDVRRRPGSRREPAPRAPAR